MGLKEALLKDKLTFGGDPYFLGRINTTGNIGVRLFDLLKPIDQYQVDFDSYFLVFMCIFWNNEDYARKTRRSICFNYY